MFASFISTSLILLVPMLAGLTFALATLSWEHVSTNGMLILSGFMLALIAVVCAVTTLDQPTTAQIIAAQAFVAVVSFFIFDLILKRIEKHLFPTTVRN